MHKLTKQSNKISVEYIKRKKCQVYKHIALNCLNIHICLLRQFLKSVISSSRLSPVENVNLVFTAGKRTQKWVDRF